jgi:hypothetical protein
MKLLRIARGAKSQRLGALGTKPRTPFVFDGKGYLAKRVPRGLDPMQANRLEAHRQLSQSMNSGFTDMFRIASMSQKTGGRRA